MGKLKEKYPRAAKLYEVEVKPEPDKPATDKSLKAVDIIWKKKEEKYDLETAQEGSYVLRTDRLDLEDEEIWSIYTMLGQIEYAFLCMKSFLGFRPNFHQNEDRVDTHMFIVACQPEFQIIKKLAKIDYTSICQDSFQIN